MKTEQTSRNVLTVRLPFRAQKGWHHDFLLRADAHHDNPDCDQKLEKMHLDEALERNAGIIDAGDIFCAMQGKYDPRSNKSKVRDEDAREDYLDALVRNHAEFYGPYAKNWLVMGRGNHEDSILKRLETDLTERLVERMNMQHGTAIQAGGYSGWVRFMFNRGRDQRRKNLWYIHGYAGGGAVTKDRIQAQRQQAYIADADIMLSGHTHDSWVDDSTVRARLKPDGTETHEPVYYVKTPTYKDEYKDGYGGFHVASGKPPKPLGAYWLRFYWHPVHQRIETVIWRAQ